VRRSNLLWHELHYSFGNDVGGAANESAEIVELVAFLRRNSRC
jgi:hypothetical protein